MVRIRHAEFSAKGRRSENQDACLGLKVSDDLWFFAVADGMGGTRGGELASKIAIGTAKNVIQESLAKSNSPDYKDLLAEVYRCVHEALKEEIVRDSRLQGMGTTLACMLLSKTGYVWANVGDSRIYLLRDGSLEQITRDHTYIQQYIDEQGTISPVLIQQYGHYLLKVMDGQNQEPDMFPLSDGIAQWREGDVFMLCSDGLLIDKVHTNTMLFKNYISGSGNLEEACELLYRYAYHSGSDDNITIVLVELGELHRNPLSLRKYVEPSGIGGAELLALKSGLLKRITALFKGLFSRRNQ